VSLDVSLISPTVESIPCVCLSCGNKHTRVVRPQLYSANITHNLGPMAREAGIYAALWRGKDVKTAADLAIVLHEGLTILRADPERFKRYDASNGWGTTAISCCGWRGCCKRATNTLTRKSFAHH